jgi:acyl-CoA thioester hydrolase
VTTFCLEAHVTYHREVRAGFHEMYHAREGYLAATNELMSLHVSEVTRRGAPMAPEILARLARIRKAHDALPRPPQAGRAISLAARPTTR